MRIRQEIKIKFLSAAMVVLLIFSGIFGGIGFPLFYPGHELCGRRVRKVENSL